MHTDTDKHIEALIADRDKLERDHPEPRGEGLSSLITAINLQILRLQGRQAVIAFERGDPVAICKTCGEAFPLAAGHDCAGLVPKAEPDAPKCPGISNGLADLFAGIEERIIWTTKDGKRWDRLEDAIAHQRRGKIINAIYDADESNADWIATHAEQIADHAAALFAILEPFFRKGE